MPNHPKLIDVPGTFFNAVEGLLNTAPPPKSAKDKAELVHVKRTVKRVRASSRKRAGEMGLNGPKKGSRKKMR